MAGLFQTLEVGKSALLTHQLSLQTIGHNIANVDTPGYSRQRVIIEANDPNRVARYSIGTGVTATRIEHIRDLFLADQYRNDNRSLGQWTYKQKTLSHIESVIGEPNDNAIADLLDKFWGSWHSLARGDSGSRDAILAQTNLLTNSLHQLSSQLVRLQDSADRDMVQLTEDVNAMTGEIARLNHDIKRLEIGTAAANDLRDTRDYIVDQLANIIDVNTHETKQGDFLVYMGSIAIVDQDTNTEIGVETVNIDNRVRHILVWKNTSLELNNLNGQLKGVMDARDKIIPGYLDQLDQLARTLVEEVNAVHRTGYGADGSTGRDFFDPSGVTAATISVDPGIAADTTRIASSLSGEEGDYRIAKAIAELQNLTILNNNTTTINEFYSNMVGTLGIETDEARSMTDNYEVLLNQIESARLSVQGVSLDEEMTNMIKFQQAYDAAARVITAMDQALDTVISKMGIVGR